MKKSVKSSMPKPKVAKGKTIPSMMTGNKPSKKKGGKKC